MLHPAIVVEGIHKDTGRSLKFTICAKDEPHPPSQFMEIIRSMDKSQLSLLAFSDAMATVSVSYGQALARIVGCPEFRSRFEASSFEVLSFDHLIEQYPQKENPIEFEMMHRSKLDPAPCKKDTVHFISMESSPYFIGDYMKSNPQGEYELAATVLMRDLVWVEDDFVLVGPEYFWHEQYLNHIGTRADFRSGRLETLNRLMYARSLEPAIDKNLGQVVRYRFEDRAPSVDMLATTESSPMKEEVHIVGSNRWILSKGMGVVFELPVAITCNRSYLERLYGSVVGFRPSLDQRHPYNIQFRLHLADENIPGWLLSRVAASHFMQTNILFTISEAFLAGVYSIWPAVMFQRSCVPGLSDAHVHD